MVCKEGGKGNCRKRSVTYETSCDTCRAANAQAGIESTPQNVSKYIGEASRSAAERSAEHLADFRAEKEESHIWKHKVVSHPDEEVTFTMKVIKKHKSAFERQVQEFILIELNQVDGNILNSKSGFNRCLIPRLTIMMGDRVMEDRPASRETCEEEVETAFEARDKSNRKSKCREEGVLNNNNPNNPPPPTKRRRRIFRSQNNPKFSPNLISHDDASDPVCDRPLPSDPDQINVRNEARVTSQLDEQMRDNAPSQSTEAERKYFPIYNSDLPRHVGRGKQNKVRKEKKLKVIPPANNNKITDHFIPVMTNSETRDDEKIHLVRSPGCQR